MSLSNYLSFFILVLTLVYSPGPMTMFMMVNGMKMQYRNIWPILMGANHAYLLSIIIFALGLTTLLQQNILLLKGVQITGIIYLFYLAYQQFHKKTITDVTTESNKVTKPQLSLYMRGALIAFSNPKTIVLFAIIFPQFVTEGDQRLLQISILGATFLILQLSSGCFYAFFGRRIKAWVEKPDHQTLINRFCSFILVIIAILLMTKL